MRLLAASAAMSGLVTVAGSVASAGAAPSSHAMVTIRGAIGGLKLTSQVANSDGTVTATWADASGRGFVYSGPAGASLTVTAVKTHLVDQRPEHSLAVAVTVPPPVGDPISQAVAYTKAERSVQNDAARVVGVAGLNQPGDTLRTATTQRQAVVAANPSPGQTINSWCVGNIYGDAARVWATTCDKRILTQAIGNNWYWFDNMLASSQDTHAGHSLTSLTTYMTYYPSGSNVVSWVPSSPTKTDCHDYTFGISAYGVSLTSTNQICGGSISLYDLNTNANGSGGARWSGTSSALTSINPIMEVHAPTANQSSVLNLAMSWN